MKVSIVIPIYNAALFIERNTCLILNECHQLNVPFEILFCDDNSTDQSKEILKEMALMYDEVKVYFNMQNEGIGFTLKELFYQAKGENVIYLDCDLPFGAQIIPKLYNALNQYDVVVASRYLNIKNDIDFTRRVASRLYYYLCYFLFTVNVVDLGSGSVGLKKSLTWKLHLTKSGFGIHIELFVKLKALNAKIKEFPCRVVNKEKGSFSIWKHGPSIVRETIEFFMEEGNR